MTQFNSHFLSILKSVPESCVFALISDSTLTCLVSHSSSLQSRIGALIESFPSDVRLVVFDVLDNLEYKLLLAEKHKNELIVAGYTIINPKQYINYRVGIRYSRNLKQSLVVLYNKRKDIKVVGIFDSIEGAQEFVDLYYKEQELIVPVYSTNEDTREMVMRERKGNKNGRI